MALREDDKFNDEMQRCEVNSWRMNPAAIIATALFTPYCSYAEYALCYHEIKKELRHKKNIERLWTLGILSLLFLLPDRVNKY